MKAHKIMNEIITRQQQKNDGVMKKGKQMINSYS